jgi:hypothetical protein
MKNVFRIALMMAEEEKHWQRNNNYTSRKKKERDIEWSHPSYTDEAHYS